MITYVNTVLISNQSGAKLTAEPAAAANMNTPSADAGKFIFMNCDPDAAANGIYNITADTDTFKIGVVTAKNTAVVMTDGTVSYKPVIKWSNEIKAKDVKSLTKLTYKDDSEDKVVVDFDAANLNPGVLNTLALGNKLVVLRLTFKDMPTRFRNWTESYDYTTSLGETSATLAQGIAAVVNKATKRARVTASVSGTAVTFEAMPYDDDNSVDSINVANKVRFNVNIYFKDPQAVGFASSNKYPLGGANLIKKTPGVQYPASAKLVRDRESQAMGYQGIINRGPGTWPIIKPAMETNLAGKYDGVTFEFENMYRAADDIFRKTKQTVEIYADKDNSTIANIVSTLEGIIANNKTLSGTAIDNSAAYDKNNY